MNKYDRMIQSASYLLIALNAGGGIVSGIWLAILGEWPALIVGVLSLVISHFLLGLLLLPNLPAAASAVAFAEKGRLGMATFFTGLSLVYISGLIAVWGSAFLIYFASISTGRTIIPLLLWSYGVASGPWTFLAQKEQQSGGNNYSAMSTFYLQVGYIFGILVVLLVKSVVFGVLSIFLVMTFNCVMQIIASRAEMKADAQFRHMTNGDEGEWS